MNNRDERLLDTIDQDLYQDRLTMAPIRHAVVADDGAVYEASSLLALLREHGGRSLLNPQHIVRSFVRVPALQNTLDRLLADDPEREDDYDIELVLADIQQRLDLQPLDADENRAIYALHVAMQLVRGMSVAAMAGGGMLGLTMRIPFANVLLVLIASALLGQSIYRTAETVLDASDQAFTYGVIGFAASSVGLFAGRKMGIFPEEAPDNHAPAF